MAKRKIFYKEEVRLLTCDEYMMNQDALPKFDEPWWLMDKGAGNQYGFVVGYNGLYRGELTTEKFDIRPLYITTYSSVGIGEETIAYGTYWQKFAEVVEDNFTTRHYYIAKVPIANDVFDEKTNVYDEASIKKIIEDKVNITPELDETDLEKTKRLKLEEKMAKKNAAKQAAYEKKQAKLKKAEEKKKNKKQAKEKSKDEQ